jgi:hypothetical protein
MAHPGVCHDQLEGLPPNISILPGYYCATSIPSNVNSRETLGWVYTPQTATPLVEYVCMHHSPGFISPSRNLSCLATMCHLLL